MAFNKTLFLTRLKKVMIITMWISLITSLCFSMAFVNKMEGNIKCTAINVHITSDAPAGFVDREMVLKSVMPGGNESKILGSKIEELDVSKIENKLLRNPMIKWAEVYTDMNGKLDIHIKQRRPILRILNAFGESYYIDEDGLKMPLSPDFTAQVPVASGYIFEHNTGKDSMQSFIGKELFKIATYVDKDTFWNAQIEQIFVTAENEFNLYPSIGDQVILFGNSTDIEDKFARLFLFYKEAMTRIGWSTYSSISVEYKNQIVGKRKN
ncbi:MAG: hypothetical protein MUC81_01480 [Bacteroidia bacterium]|jgi:cell division protein FtsQ|nr:hypothetical protein [Bacteroidia bacterium]